MRAEGSGGASTSGLGEAGATVYVTGRSTRGAPRSLPGDIDSTADEVDRMGGLGIAVRCDHRVDLEVEALFARARDEQGHIDVLINVHRGVDRNNGRSRKLVRREGIEPSTY